jgi:CheY-like chemotaxis protein
MEDHAAIATAVQAKEALKVLVVDDEPLLIMTIADMLTDLGHTPIEAESGSRALEALKEHGDIDLMITDQAMPGMSGIELARQAFQLYPRLKIILATGYDTLPKGLDIALERLPKPYFEHDLSAAIERAIASRR